MANLYTDGRQVIETEKQALHLLKEKAVWLESSSSLLLADTHFGKAGHFRKSGIPIPENIHDHDYQRLEMIIEKFKPKAIYFLGDLFHSDLNQDWIKLKRFIQRFENIPFHLVKGNHDILPEELYTSSFLSVHEECVDLPGILLSHEPSTFQDNGNINICGHLHPGIVLHGSGKQRLRLPCFYLQQNQVVLPAFGTFTGLWTIPCHNLQQAFAVTEKMVIPINLKDKVG